MTNPIENPQPGERIALRDAPRKIEMPIGVVLQRRPGVSKWMKWSWVPVAVLPGAPPADWKELRRDGETIEYHAATVKLELYRSDVEGYQVSLTMKPPSVFVILRKSEDPDSAQDVYVHLVTASAYEAQDYQDSGEEIVEPVAMPDGLIAWINDYCTSHFQETRFMKRRRDEKRVDHVDDGIGDKRIRQTADVYRAPGQAKSAMKDE
jgi:hypothetical protein